MPRLPRAFRKFIEATAEREAAASGTSGGPSGDVAIADVTGLTAALAGKQAAATVLTNTTAAFTTAQESKLAGIATGATANASDAALRDRATHTGAQAIGTVTGLQTALDGKAATSHTHDDRYYTEAEVNALLAALPGGDAWTYVVLGSDFTISTTANNNVTGLFFTPAANTNYEIEGLYLLRTATATTGARPGVAWPAGYADGAAWTTAPNSATANASQFHSPATGTANAAGTGLPATGRSYLGTLWGLLIMGASPSGNFQITLASETAAVNVTMRAGSFLRYRTYS